MLYRTLYRNYVSYPVANVVSRVYRTFVSARVSHIVSYCVSYRIVVTYLEPYRNLYRKLYRNIMELRYRPRTNVHIDCVSLLYLNVSKLYAYREFDTPEYRYVTIRQDTLQIHPIRLGGKSTPIQGEKGTVAQLVVRVI